MEVWQKYPSRWNRTDYEVKFGLTGLVHPTGTELYAQRSDGTDTSNRHVYRRVVKEALAEKGTSYRSYRQISEFE